MHALAQDTAAGPQSSTTRDAMVARAFRVLFWLLALLIGARQAWDDRFTMTSDGLSYLELGAAAARGDWGGTWNAVWSPLYPWLIGGMLRVFQPTPYWEAATVQLLNLLIFVATLAAFDFFLRQLVHHARARAATDGAHVASTSLPPEWLFVVLGYLALLTGTVRLVGVSQISPDMLVALIVFLAGGLLLRLHSGHTGWGTFLTLGLVLGVGYLVKAPLFAVGFVFLAGAMATAPSIGVRAAATRTLLALGVFLLLAAPYVVAISAQRGRVTLGESARYNYARFVIGREVAVHWQGGPPDHGMPLHPTRRLMERPAIYEFATPLAGVYPPWTDPAYWYEGGTVSVSPRRQLEMVARSTWLYFGMTRGLDRGLVAVLLVLLVIDARGRQPLRELKRTWWLFAPAVASIAMYSLVAVAGRYVGAYVTLILAGTLLFIRLPAGAAGRGLARAALLALLVTSVVPPLWSAAGAARRLALAPVRGAAEPNRSWEIAHGLEQLGVPAGTAVGFVGNSIYFHWARMAGVRVVAEVRSVHAPDVELFWAADSVTRTRARETFRRAGARLIVADTALESMAAHGWRPLGTTGYSAILLDGGTPLVDDDASLPARQLGSTAGAGGAP